MSLLVAVPFGVAAAVAYGVSTTVQHAAAHTGTRAADPHRLVQLLRNRRWLTSIGGDGVGFMFQAVALATGPVVVVQPLLLLTLPVALAAGALINRRRPRRRDYLACLAIAGALGVFFVLTGVPSGSRHPSTQALVATIVAALVCGGALCAAVTRRIAAVRATVYGGVAGAWFGLFAVLFNAAAGTYHRVGLAGLFGPADGLIELVGLVVVGLAGMVLTQVSFQVGVLAAALPANQTFDSGGAVVLSAILLGEYVPADAWHLLGYSGCLAAAVFGIAHLASAAGGGTARADAVAAPK